MAILILFILACIGMYFFQSKKKIPLTKDIHTIKTIIMNTNDSDCDTTPIQKTELDLTPQKILNQKIIFKLKLLGIFLYVILLIFICFNSTEEKWLFTFSWWFLSKIFYFVVFFVLCEIIFASARYDNLQSKSIKKLIVILTKINGYILAFVYIPIIFSLFLIVIYFVI